MEAIVGGGVAAFCWAAAVMSSARCAKRIGALSTLAGVMVVGLAITLPAMALTDVRSGLTSEQVGLLVASGLSNVVGLVLAYSALSLGKVAVVAPILSTEGALGAAIAIVAGEPLAAGTSVILAAIAIGVMLTATEAGVEALEASQPETGGLPAAAFAVGAALCFGVNLYVTGRIGVELPVAWAVLPARLAGVALVALPLIVARRLRITRDSLPFILVSGIGEVVGIGAFALGARGGIAVTSVVASQFAAIAAVVSVVLFHERLARHQVVGVSIIAIGVAVLTALQG